MSTLIKTRNVKSPWTEQVATIAAIRPEVPGVDTYDLQFDDELLADAYHFAPGQFNMLYLPGFGESAISVSSDPDQDHVISHTVRVAGNVTRALSHLEVGDQIGVRGPFGRPWPMDEFTGKDLVIACGGIGIAPLRPAIYHVINHRHEYGRVLLLYGSRTSGDLLFQDEYDDWRDANIEVDVTVDMGDSDWHGHIGVVPVLFYRLRLEPEQTCVLTCGPEIMMRFVIFEALARKVPPEHIFVSMERNMSCGLGLCGRCQLGPVFVCKDGPVFDYVHLEPYLHLENL